MDCIFCKIVEGKIPSIKLYEDEGVLAFMDIRPGNRGHCLVIPKKHAADIFEMQEPELKLIGPALKRLATACRDGLGADGVNIIQSNGAAAFQSVFHIHFHILPRYEGDSIKLPWHPDAADPKELEQVAGLIRKGLK